MSWRALRGRFELGADTIQIMIDTVRITDVSPRDGLQNEPGIIPTADKVRLVQLLCEAGVDEVEVTSFVSPKWVPQLGDADDVLAQVRAWVEGMRGRIVPLPVFTVLVPNDKGFERAVALHRSGFPIKVALFTAASETFNQKNTNASIAQSIERFRAIIPRAIEERMALRLYVSCVVACPFEGPIAPAAVRRVVDGLLALVPDDQLREVIEVDLGDTIGVAHPHEIEALLAVFTTQERDERVTLHLHDTFGRAADCVRAALRMGVRSFDGSAGGLGGCPYASTPERRAPGNISTETLIRTIEAEGFVTRTNLERLQIAATHARQIVSRGRTS